MTYQAAPSNQAPFNYVVEITLLTTSGVTEQATGVVIAPDYILTAAHVTDEATVIQVTTPDAITGSNQDYASKWTSLSNYSGLAGLTFAQSATDLGIIQLSDPTTTAPATLETGFGGGQVTIAGYPSGYSGEQMTQAPVNLDPAAADLNYANGTVMPGNSGGPLIDASGNVVGIVSTTGAASQLTAPDTSWIGSWMTQTAQPNNFFVSPNGSGGAEVAGSTPSSGGPSYLQAAYVWNNPNECVAVIAQAPNAYLVTEAPNSTLIAASGDNVLVALSGSNILVGGTGADGGFDDFSVTAAYGGGWTDIVNMHPGDMLTVWDFDPNVGTYSWLSNQGVAGLTGATLVTSSATGGAPEAVTFAGMSVPQAQAALSFSKSPDTGVGRSYLLVQDHS